MEEKFAIIDYVDTIDEIPFKLKIYKSEKLVRWYINKFNPYIKEEIKLLDKVGYKIKLPIVKDEAYEDEKFLIHIFNKTLLSLNQLNVKITKKPYEFYYYDDDIMNFCNKKNIIVFFILMAIKKAVKMINKTMKDVEILIIDGQDSKITNIVIDSIYEHINYLNIFSKRDLSKKIEEIYYDNGLNICLIKDNNSIKNCDIVINLNENFFDKYSSLKRGCIYFDLSNNFKSLLNICIKREDVLVVDDFNLKCKDEVFTVLDFELAFYLLSSNYKNYINGYSSKSIFKNIIENIKQLEVSVHSFRRLNKTIGNATYKKYKSNLK